jgi:hypothetical protein
MLGDRSGSLAAVATVPPTPASISSKISVGTGQRARIDERQHRA